MALFLAAATVALRPYYNVAASSITPVAEDRSTFETISLHDAIHIRAWSHNCSHRAMLTESSSMMSSVSTTDMAEERLTCMRNGAVARGNHIIAATQPCGYFSGDQADGNDCAARTLLEKIHADEIGPKDLQLVINRYDEDVSWSDVFDKVRVIYDKSPVVLNSSQASHVVPTDNVGREANTYLKHIVQNYDRLANRTVFMHGTPPGCGFFFANSNKETGNHMMANISVIDYMTSEEHMFAPITMVFNKNLSLCATRLGFADVPAFTSSPSMAAPLSFRSRPVATVPPADEWLPWEANPYDQWVRDAKAAGEPEQYLWPEVYSFVTDYTGSDEPVPEQIYYAQGAQFSASREAIRRVPLWHWEKLLDYTNDRSNPRSAFPYLVELLWPALLQMPMPKAGEDGAAEPAPPVSADVPSLGSSWHRWSDTDRPPACANELWLEVAGGDASYKLASAAKQPSVLYARDHADDEWQKLEFSQALAAPLLTELLAGGNRSFWAHVNMSALQRSLDGHGAVSIEWNGLFTPSMTLVDKPPSKLRERGDRSAEK